MKLAILLLLLFINVQASESKQILLLHSYNKGLKWSDDLSRGIEDILLKHKEYEITTEYMDSKKNHSKEYKNTVYKLFLQKLKETQYDLVIVIDNYAINFYLKYEKELFKNSKIIFCGMDKDAPGIDLEEARKRKIPVVLETKDVDKNVQFILKSLPKLENLYIINDRTLTSSLINYRIKEAANKIKKYLNVKVVLDGDIQQIEKNIKNLPKNSAVLFGSLFLDNKGRYIPYYKVNDLLINSPAPVFSLSDSHLGNAVIGGMLITGYEQGIQAGALAQKVLNNEEIDINKAIVAKAIWKFDYKILKKYNLTNIKLPKGSEEINLPKNFFERYRNFINISFVIFPFILILLLIAILNIIKRVKVEKKLIKQKKLSEAQLNNLESMIFWINYKGIIKGCNTSFRKFINKEDEEIIGKNIDKILKPIEKHLNKNKLLLHPIFEFAFEKRDYLVKNSYINNSKQDIETVTIITDITEKKQTEINKQFIIQQSKLSEIGEMLSALVHQWKTPLVELSAVAHKMYYYNKKNKLTNENINNFYDVIMKQIIFMGDTMDSFRNFIKPVNKPINFNIDLGIKEILNILDSSLKYSNIKIEYINVLDKDIYLLGYPNEFKQVILNIINNAKDSILEARLYDKKRGQITIVLTQIEESVKIKIVDDGIGLTNTLEKKIFDPYFTTKRNGTGIGLYMVKLIIEKKMQGRINAYSQDVGAKFLITIPKGEEE